MFIATVSFCLHVLLSAISIHKYLLCFYLYMFAIFILDLSHRYENTITDQFFKLLFERAAERNFGSVKRCQLYHIVVRAMIIK